MDLVCDGSSSEFPGPIASQDLTLAGTTTGCWSVVPGMVGFSLSSDRFSLSFFYILL